MKKNKIIILYVFLFVLYPLFMTNGYKNTVMTKCISFALITGVAFLLLHGWTMRNTLQKMVD